MLWPLLLLVFLALFLAVTLHSFVDWLDSKRIKHWVSQWVVIGSLVLVLGVGMALLVPALINQAVNFSREYATIERIWLKPFLREGVSEKHDLQQDKAFGEKN